MIKTLTVFLSLMFFSEYSNQQTISSLSSEDVIAESVKQFMKAIEDTDSHTLDLIVSDELVYGHSNGKVQNKNEFIAEILSGKPFRYTEIQLSNQTIKVVGETAIVRHVFTAKTINEETTGTLTLGNVLIWQKQDGKWRLLARQAYR